MPYTAKANNAGPPVCDQTAEFLFKACKTDLDEEFSVAAANCVNESATAKQKQTCIDAATAARNEGRDECGGQKEARLDLCDLIGQERYAPDFDPANFDPDFSSPNTYFPLNVHDVWVYEAADEMVTVEVLDQTKLIEGVTCRVVNDVVTSAGKLDEDTDDWFAQTWDGTIWYCGEKSAQFESFDGDDPALPELVGVNGSFKAGRDNAQPGTLIEGNPQVGDAFRQEVLYGEAEDAAGVLSINYSFGKHPELDQLVPKNLAKALCHKDCLVTREFSPLNPGASELKYYSPGIGLFLEVAAANAEVLKLVACKVNSVVCVLPP
ncbi:MAG: hypothetical protein EXR85_02485 [Xanthomonadales bacterium]|nr:hypothetical protein [Xanthomonadales bacterium]